MVRPRPRPPGGRHRPLPPYANIDDIAYSIMERARERAWHTRHPELGALTGLPVRDLEDCSARGDYWLACQPADGTSAEALRDQLLKLLGVTIHIPVGLPRPLPTMIRTWACAGQPEDLQASLTALEKALTSPQQQRLTSYY